MVTIRSANDIALSLIDFFNTAQPTLDTKPGTVARDLFVDSVSSQLSLVYNELANISNLQSLRLVSGFNLDKLAQNFGATRKPAAQASGIAIFTFASIPAVISLNAGNTVTASSGATFSIINGVSVDPTQLNSYRAVAVKYQNNLNFLNITDPYAVEVTVQATSAGSAGNIAAYSINSTSIPGVSHVTNAVAFTGGSDQETDATFRNRVLAIFSGANVGTALGYTNVALAASPSVDDAYVVGPGNPLMTRDGTVVVKNPDGSYTIISDGSGGDVDIYILGTVLTSYTDSFIYQDKSNTNNPANAANDFVLGQIAGQSNLTITQKRVQDIANGALPAQPVQEILQVTGSLSGSNFLPKSTDSNGVVSGNYELIKDTGFYAGSPWGRDTFAWISNQITMHQEDEVKSTFNGQDTTQFTDVLQIPEAQQNISITNENSLVSSTDNSMITLLHTPATNVTRVLNVNTGERYTIVNQNVSGTGTVNTTGVIQISGNTLPSSSDILQVDYTWIVSYDPFSDYDGKILNNNPRSNVDSVDWGIANAIRYERTLFTPNSTNTLYTGIVKHPVSYVVSANVFSSTKGIVSASTVSNYTSRLAIVLTNLPTAINSITNLKLANTSEEIYKTAQDDGFILNTAVAVGVQILYNVTIVLPTDTPAAIGQYVSIEYNDSDVFNIPNSTGSFASNQITIAHSNISPPTTQIFLDVTYIAAIQNVLSAGITNLPMSRSGNGFIANDNSGSLNAIKSNTMKRENQVIQKNSNNQLYVTLSINSSNYSLDGYNVITAIDLSSGLEIWNQDYPGTVSINSSGFYQLTFTGLNNPAVGDNVIIIYFADDISRFQPFTFYNRVFSKSFGTIQYNYTTNNYYVPLQSFVIESGITFNIIDTTTGLSIGSDTDGYISAVSSNGATATFSRDTFSFSSVSDLLGKSIQLHYTTVVNNAGTFNILAFNPTTNSITIAVITENINNSQVSVIGVQSGDDIWSASQSTINFTNNTLNFPSTTVTSIGSEVVVLLFTNKNLHQCPTKLAITSTDQTNNTGKMTAIGTTITEVGSVIFSATQNGLTQNILAAVASFLGTSQFPANSYMIRLMELKKVTTAGTEVLSTLATYDVFGTEIANNLLYANEMVYNPSLSNIQFTLPSTTNNVNNAPKIGDQLQITFYYATDNASESVYFTRNGTLYTNSRFAFIEQLYIASGFSTTQSARFTLAYFTQPATGTRYTIYYNYLAPKQNERISINYNYNQLITTVTFAEENSRPITANVLVKAAVELLVDATVNIVISSNYTTSASVVIQNVQNKVISTINTNTLGAVLNSSDLIVAAQSVNGVERARILAFNLDGVVGQVLTLQAQANQYFAANVITINQESLT
jgi:hypothetical protein